MYVAGSSPALAANYYMRWLHLEVHLILDMTEAKKEGEKACLSGMALNRNPHIGKKGVIANLQRAAWDRGFKEVEAKASGA